MSGTRLQSKIAMITGAGAGIGRAAALRFAAEGAHVIAADIKSDKAQETAALPFPFKGKGGMGMGTSDRVAPRSPSPSRGRVGWGWV